MFRLQTVLVKRKAAQIQGNGLSTWPCSFPITDHTATNNFSIRQHEREGPLWRAPWSPVRVASEYSHAERRSGLVCRWARKVGAAAAFDHVVERDVSDSGLGGVHGRQRDPHLPRCL